MQIFENKTKWSENKTRLFNGLCPVCGGQNFDSFPVLWSALIAEWELSKGEVNYINRQQGYYCKNCGNNLRSMALADAILCAYNFPETLEKFVVSDFAGGLHVLEINEAGGLSPILKKLPNHQLVQYPNYDMTNLKFKSETFNLVLHSDTLEHVPDPIAGLSECRRILVKSGRCIFTIPIIVGRLTRSRTGLKNSYHGTPGQLNKDFIVHTEFGVDMWRFAIEAGFTSARIHCLEYPSALAIEATVNNGR